MLLLSSPSISGTAGFSISDRCVNYAYIRIIKYWRTKRRGLLLQKMKVIAAKGPREDYFRGSNVGKADP